jgi:hypothetical protein
LNASTVRLDLPAMVIRTVILDCDFVVQHKTRKAESKEQ